MNNNFLIAEYIWVDSEDNFRSKIRILREFNGKYPEWNYDGSSTGQANTENSEIILKPIKAVPFEDKMLVLCETVSRKKVKEIFNKHKNYVPWFGLEQEYFIYKNDQPLGYTSGRSGIYYCGVNTQLGRPFVEHHLKACLDAGLTISGINAEVVSGQWEFQIGPVEGIDAADQLMIARYILFRLAERYNYQIVLHPKPLLNENGSGCHCNFSTKEMRNDIKFIHNAINKLKENHIEFIQNSGKDNYLRLTGKNETSDINTFTIGYGSRDTSIRIPNQVIIEGKGYFEDRRPAANCDPYIVMSMILESLN
jgi:glutamine synthetase